MSKKEPKYDNLPKHQRKIVLCLAKEGPMIIRETNTKIKGEYTSTNRAFHELEGKGLIQKVSVRQYRKREFLRYWLTEKGIASALCHNADPEILLGNVKKAYPNDWQKASLVEVLNAFPEDLRQLLLRASLPESKMGPKETIGLIMVGIVKGLDAEQVNKKMIPILRKYPELLRFYKQGFKRSLKQIEHVVQNFEGVES